MRGWCELSFEVGSDKLGGAVWADWEEFCVLSFLFFCLPLFCLIGKVFDERSLIQ